MLSKAEIELNTHYHYITERETVRVVAWLDDETVRVEVTDGESEGWFRNVPIKWLAYLPAPEFTIGSTHEVFLNDIQRLRQQRRKVVIEVSTYHPDYQQVLYTIHILDDGSPKLSNTISSFLDGVQID